MNTLPNHIAIICDGNRRWAKKHKLPEFSGHKYAVETTIQKLIDYHIKLKIPYISFWVLSTENWHRGKNWMAKYFRLMDYFFKTNLQKLISKGVKVKAIGNLKELPKNIQQILKDLEEKSKHNTKITSIIAINYGGREEIIRTMNKLIKNPVFQRSAVPTLGRGRKTNRVLITEKEFSQYLDTAGIPDPDLIIRTAGEQRLSGFLLWQSEYAEFYFTKTLFPDFSPEELDKALKDYNQRKRNFGQ